MKGAESNLAEGERQLEAGNFAEAEASLSQAAREGGGPASRRVGLRLQLAEAQRKQAKLAEAEDNARQALEVATREQDDGLQLLCLHALSEVLVERGNLPEAQSKLEEAVKIDAQRKTPDPILMARRLRQLGIVYHRLGRAAESTAKLSEAAAMYEKNCGEQDSETGQVLAELAVAYRAQEKYADAEKCFTRALRIHEQSCGRQSAEALRDLSELARTLAESGEWKRATAEYERALTLQESLIGGTFENTAEMQLTLAGLYVDEGNHVRAQELLTHAVGGLKSGGGPRLGIAYEALAHVHERLGHLENALATLECAAAVWEECERTEELAANAEHRAEIAARLAKEEEEVA